MQRRGMLWLGVVLACLAFLAPAASALVVHEPDGHFLGVAPRSGVDPGSATTGQAGQQSSTAASGGNLQFHNGFVLHSTKPYLVFWDPPPNPPTDVHTPIAARTRGVLQGYLASSAAQGLTASNVYAVGRQYTDATGFADDGQTFFADPQALVDTQPYPPGDATNCSSSYPTCLTDAQLQDELRRLTGVGAGLPTGTGADAPVYFLVTPADVNVCTDANSCADPTSANSFCAYHSYFTASTGDVVYASIPLLTANKGCQHDNTPALQAPNGSSSDGTWPDVAVDNLSQEYNEAITDPEGSGWYNDTSLHEQGDNCEAWGRGDDPLSGTNSRAYQPTLGGDKAAGTLFDQVIGAHQYYTQSEWSNADATCDLRVTGTAPVPHFEAPATVDANRDVLFDPSASTSTRSYSSSTWDFGDGTTSFNAGNLLAASHAYATPGSYTVKLTVVDKAGNLTTYEKPIDVVVPPTADFSRSLGPNGITYDASASTAADQAKPLSYSWSFGDGTTSSDPVVTHRFVAPGSYLVTLTVTDSLGGSATKSTTETLTAPTASFTTAVASGGQGLTYDATGSSDPNAGGALVSYQWNFGDGTTATGATVTHRFVAPGDYTVSLTVTDNIGLSATTTESFFRHDSPTIVFGSIPSFVTVGTPISFDGSRSSDPTPGSTITAYSWDFGDGATASGPRATHAYDKPGTYAITLTVSDSRGLQSAVFQRITVIGVPQARISLSPAHPASGLPVRFSASGSTDSGAALVSYAWSFGDRHTGGGVRPSHTYRHPGRYTARLVVTDANHLVSTANYVLRVVTPEKMTALRLSPSRRGVRLTVRLSGPGILHAGAHRYRIRRARRLSVEVGLSGDQKRRLAGGQRVLYRLKVVFSPQAGRTIRRTAKLTL